LRAVREYLMALDAARSDEESGGGEDGGSSVAAVDASRQKKSR